VLCFSRASQCNFAAAALVYFCIKEGHGLSLEQLERLWEDHTVSARHSAKWVPPGYAKRGDAVEQSANEKKAIRRDMGEESHVEDRRDSV